MYSIESLLEMCKQGNKTLVKQILATGLPVDAQDKNGQSALMVACEFGHLTLVKLLLKKGAKVNLKNNYGLTALSFAKNQKIKNLLLANRADVQVKSQQDAAKEKFLAAVYEQEKEKLVLEHIQRETATLTQQEEEILSTFCQQENPQLFETLFGKNSTVCFPDDDGKTVLMHAVEQDSFPFLCLALCRDKNINAQDKNGQTALLRTVTKGNILWIKKLLFKGADINLQDNLGQTALMLASQKGYLDLVKFLVSRGAELDRQDNLGQTALMLACQEGHLLLIKFLVKRGADLSLKSNDGKTALRVAAFFGHSDAVVFLQKQIAYEAKMQYWASLYRISDRRYFSPVSKNLTDEGNTKGSFGYIETDADKTREEFYPD